MLQSPTATECDGGALVDTFNACTTLVADGRVSPFEACVGALLGGARGDAAWAFVRTCEEVHTGSRMF